MLCWIFCKSALGEAGDGADRGLKKNLDASINPLEIWTHL